MAGHATFTPAQDAFQFFEDGTESGATAIAAENTNITRNILSNKLHLRVRIQETGGASGVSTDDWQIRADKNSATSYADINTTSSNVRCDTTSGLTDAGATTQRLSSGTGSFEAGQQEEGNGQVTDFLQSASGFTEHVFALDLQIADLANNDTLDFQVWLNGSAITYSVTPRITISKLFTPNQKATRWYDNNGGEAASTPLAAQDTDINVNVSSGNAIVHLRALVQETGGLDGVATDDWQAKISKNSGAYADVNAASSNVKSPGAAGSASWSDDFSVGANEPIPHGIAFSADGTKMYIIGNSTDTVYRYPLSTAWDLTTAGATDQSWVTGIALPSSLRFKTDGTKLYIGELVTATTNDKIHQFPLSTAWDLSTVGTVEATLTIGADVGDLAGIEFKTDGTKVYAIGSTGIVHQYGLSTAWSLSTAGSSEGSKDLSGDGAEARGLALSSDGLTLFVINSGDVEVNQYALGTAWTISTTGTVAATLDVSGVEAGPSDIFIGNSGLTLYHVGYLGDAVDEWDLPAAWALTTGGATLTDGAATTNRATNGITDPSTGSFVAGEQEAVNGLIEDHQLTSGNFTEHVIAFELIAADLANADTIDARIYLNGSAISYTITPRITITKSSDPVILAENASFSHSPQAALLGRGLRIKAESVSFSHNPQAVALVKGKRIAAEAVNIAHNPQSVLLTKQHKIQADAASFSHNPQAVSTEIGYKLLADKVDFNHNPQSVLLNKGKRLAVDFAAFSHNPQAVDLRKTNVLQANFASFDHSPQEVLTTFGKLLAANFASYSHNPQVVNLNKGKRIAADNASFSHNPQSTVLVWDRLIQASAVTFNHSPQDVLLKTGKKLLANAASFSHSPQAVALNKGKLIKADAASFSHSPQNVNLLIDRVLQATAANFSLTVQEALLTLDRVIIADAATFSYNPQDVVLTVGTVGGGFTILAEVVSFTHNPQAILLEKGYNLKANPVLFNLTLLDLELVLFGWREDPLAAGLWTPDAGIADTWSVEAPLAAGWTKETPI